MVLIRFVADKVAGYFIVLVHLDKGIISSVMSILL